MRPEWPQISDSSNRKLVHMLPRAALLRIFNSQIRSLVAKGDYFAIQGIAISITSRQRRQICESKIRN